MSGERPVWVICIVALVVVGGMLAPYLASGAAARHPRSVRRYRGEMRE